MTFTLSHCILITEGEHRKSYQLKVTEPDGQKAVFRFWVNASSILHALRDEEKGISDILLEVISNVDLKMKNKRRRTKST